MTEQSPKLADISSDTDLASSSTDSFRESGVEHILPSYEMDEAFFNFKQGDIPPTYAYVLERPDLNFIRPSSISRGSSSLGTSCSTSIISSARELGYTSSNTTLESQFEQHQHQRPKEQTRRVEIADSDLGFKLKFQNEKSHFSNGDTITGSLTIENTSKTTYKSFDRLLCSLKGTFISHDRIRESFFEDEFLSVADLNSSWSSSEIINNKLATIDFISNNGELPADKMLKPATKYTKYFKFQLPNYLLNVNNSSKNDYLPPSMELSDFSIRYSINCSMYTDASKTSKLEASRNFNFAPKKDQSKNDDKVLFPFKFNSTAQFLSLIRNIQQEVGLVEKHRERLRPPPRRASQDLNQVSDSDGIAKYERIARDREKRDQLIVGQHHSPIMFNDFQDKIRYDRLITNLAYKRRKKKKFQLFDSKPDLNFDNIDITGDFNLRSNTTVSYSLKFKVNSLAKPNLSIKDVKFKPSLHAMEFSSKHIIPIDLDCDFIFNRSAPDINFEGSIDNSLNRIKRLFSSKTGVDDPNYQISPHVLSDVLSLSSLRFKNDSVPNNLNLKVNYDDWIYRENNWEININLNFEIKDLDSLIDFQFKYFGLVHYIKLPISFYNEEDGSTQLNLPIYF